MISGGDILLTPWKIILFEISQKLVKYSKSRTGKCLKIFNLLSRKKTHSYREIRVKGGGLRRSTRWYKNYFHISYGLGATDPELKLQTPLSSRDIAILFSHLFKLIQFWFFFSLKMFLFFWKKQFLKSFGDQKVPILAIFHVFFFIFNQFYYYLTFPLN